MQTDFIFTVAGEELGFVGCAVIVALLAFIVLRAIRAAQLADDMFGMLVASGVAIWFAFQSFVNIGMTIGIMPITGLPLPFVSYGGSAIFADMIAIGLLQSVRRHHTLFASPRRRLPATARAQLTASRATHRRRARPPGDEVFRHDSAHGRAEAPAHLPAVKEVTLPQYRVVEICAGAGGQSLGLEIAGFEHELAVELDQNACATLRHNRPHWKVAQGDVASPDVWDPAAYAGIDLLAGGVPCPPFTIAGKQLGATDERDLFAWAIELCGVIGPRALLLENVRGLSLPRFAAYRQHVLDRLAELGYAADWRLLHAADYGVPQLRPRFVLVAMRPDDFAYFSWPQPHPGSTATVGETLLDLMAANGWPGAAAWAGEGERHRADHRRRVQEARRRRPGADPRQAGLARARRGRARRGRRRAVGGSTR